MKTATASTIVHIEEEILRDYRSVNETLATNITFPLPTVKNRSFGVTDLWKCRQKLRRHGIRIR